MKLTADDVYEAALTHSRERKSPTDPYVHLTEYDWQAIADELNAALGSGTCDEREHDGRYECPGCGCVVYYDLLSDDSWTIYAEDCQIPFNACPECGKAVGR